jgi:hypothetical protein
VRRLLPVLIVAASAAACAGPPPVKDYDVFYEQTPYTIVVLPVVNQTVDAVAPRFFLSTIGKPLIDRGYYVLPVQMTAEILESEGLGDGGAILKIPPGKLREYFGADALLRVTLTAWDTSYLILASSVTVAMHYELISTRSGQLLWETNLKKTINSNSGGGGLLGALASAAVTAAATDYVPMALEVNTSACGTLPPGPYHPRFEQARKEYLEASRRAKEKERQKAEGEAQEKPKAPNPK